MFVVKRIEMIIIAKNVHLNSVMKNLELFSITNGYENTRIQTFILNFLQKVMV